MAEVWRQGDKNRDELEMRLLGLLRDELAEKLSGYVMDVEGKGMSSGIRLVISLPELQSFVPSMKATVSWRYKKLSFMSDWKRQDVIGIKVEFERDSRDNYRSNSRSYTYDFKNECLKPDTFQKLVAFVKGESEVKIHRFKETGKRQKAQKQLLQQAVAKLKTAGYTVTVSKYAFQDESKDADVPFMVARPNGKFEQPLKVLTSGLLSHNLGIVDLKDVANFVGCLEQTLRYTK